MCTENIKASPGDHGQDIPVLHMHADEYSHVDCYQGRGKPKGEAEGWWFGVLNRPFGAEWTGNTGSLPTSIAVLNTFLLIGGEHIWNVVQHPASKVLING